MPNDSARDLLAKLLKRKDELRSEFEALQNLIDHYQRLLGVKALDEDEPTLDLRISTNSRKVRSANLSQLIAEARRIIVGEGRPMKRGELARRLEANGYPIVGLDKPKVLGTNLWRSGQFVHIDGEGYWPSDIPRIQTR